MKELNVMQIESVAGGTPTTTEHVDHLLDTEAFFQDQSDEYYDNIHKAMNERMQQYNN